MPNIVCLYMDSTKNRTAHFDSLPLKSFAMPIIDFNLLTIIVSIDVLGLNASDQTLESFSFSHFITVQ